MTEDSNSVSNAIEALGECKEDVAAVELLWERFFKRLCAFTEGKIFNRHKSMITADEIASDAFLALIDGIREKRFEKVRNRDELWQMLTLIAARRAANAQRRLMQAKRGGRITGGDFTLSEPCIDNIVDYLHRDPGPDICAELGDLTRYLLRLLPDDQIRSVATWRMAGYSNSEIAQKLNCTERTIERKLKLIRELWSRNSAESNHS